MEKQEKISYSGIMSKRPSAMKCLFVLSLGAVLVWAAMAQAQTNPVFLPLKAHQLMGMRVENLDGQKVGTVRNLVLDIKTGKVKYAVIGSGGFLGARSTLKLAPAQAMSAATTKRETLAVNATTLQWNNVPAFKLSSLASLAEANNASEISRHFKKPQTKALTTPKNSLSITGGQTGQQMKAPEPELQFASDLVGMRVVNQKQEKIGEVSDLLVGFDNARPAFAIISSGRLFHRQNQYAVPLSALSASGKDHQLTLNADMPALQQAPPFDQRAWEASSKNTLSQIYQYSSPED